MKRREDDLDDSIQFQRELIRAMNTALPENYYYKDPNKDNSESIGCIVRGPGVYCCDDPDTGKPLTYAEFFDMHAMTMQVIAEVCERHSKQKILTDIENHL